MAMSAYSFDEADDMVQVCTELTEAPDDGLECSIVSTLWLIDGSKAGMYNIPVSVSLTLYMISKLPPIPAALQLL